MATLPSDILNKVKKKNNMTSNELIIEKTRGTVTGSFIGGAVGLIYAYRAKKSYLVFGVIGVMLGGLISNILIGKEINKPLNSKPKTEEEDEEQ